MLRFTYFENNLKQNLCDKSQNNKIKSLLLGKKYSDAEKIYKNLRIVKQDNKPITIILNYCKDRCNIELENGIIKKIDGFY
jgi:hypothetical protein